MISLEKCKILKKNSLAEGDEKKKLYHHKNFFKLQI
tara:strand:+ start:1702 stop:1809 length:108 start_codon:yes stop_codon:yes gene_type:complete